MNFVSEFDSNLNIHRRRPKTEFEILLSKMFSKFLF